MFTRRACLVAAVGLGILVLGACSRSSTPAPAKRSDEESARLVPWLFASGDYGYMTREGSAAFAARFASARRFHEGRAAVALPSGKWGFIDGDGQSVVPAKYDLVGTFKNGRARVFRFQKPIVGPVQGLVVKPGVVTEWSIDRQGHESGETTSFRNVLPEIAFDAPVFEEHAPCPGPSASRWETFAKDGVLGLREIASGREVFAPRYRDFKLIEAIDGSGVRFIGARQQQSNPSTERWSVYDLGGKVVYEGAFDVGPWSNADTFSVATLSDGDAVWGAVDASGRVAVAPFASGPFAFRDGIAEAYVADVPGSVFVARDGRLFVDAGVLEARHRAVGRKVLDVDAGGR